MSALPEQRLAWRPLGEILVERGLITELELHDALREQQHEGGRLGEILFARGLVSAIDLRDALADQHGLDLRVEQAETGRRLGQILIAAGAVSTFQLAAALAEQQGLLSASRESLQGLLPRPRLYEVREIVGSDSYSLYSSRNFLDATDLAFAVLHEWEPNEIHVVCIAQDQDEELCWRYPAPG